MSKDSEKRSELVAAMSQEFRHLATATILFHQAIADRLGMHLTDHKCGDILVQTGPITAGELAERTGLTTGAITGVIDRLEKAGYVRRVKDPDDRRRVIIEPLAERIKGQIVPLFQSIGRGIADMSPGTTPGNSPPSANSSPALTNLLTRRLQNSARRVRTQSRTRDKGQLHRSDRKLGRVQFRAFRDYLPVAVGHTNVASLRNATTTSRNCFGVPSQVVVGWPKAPRLR